MKLWQALMMVNGAGAPAAAGYRYWGVRVTARNGTAYVGFTEIALRTSPGGPSVHTLSTPCIASSEYSAAWSISNTLKSDASQWANAFAQMDNLPHSFAYDLLVPTALAEIGFRASPTADRLPRDFTIVGSNASLNGPWTDVKSYAGYNGGAGWHIFSTT